MLNFCIHKFEHLPYSFKGSSLSAIMITLVMSDFFIIFPTFQHKYVWHFPYRSTSSVYTVIFCDFYLFNFLFSLIVKCCRCCRIVFWWVHLNDCNSHDRNYNFDYFIIRNIQTHGIQHFFDYLYQKATSRASKCRTHWANWNQLIKKVRPFTVIW